jgi:hypothetical protein
VQTLEKLPALGDVTELVDRFCDLGEAHA